METWGGGLKSMRMLESRSKVVMGFKEGQTRVATREGGGCWDG